MADAVNAPDELDAAVEAVIDALVRGIAAGKIEPGAGEELRHRIQAMLKAQRRKLARLAGAFDQYHASVNNLVEVIRGGH